jgi:hypothetical protein
MGLVTNTRGALTAVQLNAMPKLSLASFPDISAFCVDVGAVMHCMDMLIIFINHHAIRPAM